MSQQKSEGSQCKSTLLQFIECVVPYFLSTATWGGHIPPGLANHSIEEKAKGLYFYVFNQWRQYN